MVGDLVVRYHRLAEALDLHVVAVVRADGHAGVDDVGDLEHQLPDLLRVLALQRLQLRQPLVVGLHLRHVGVDLGLDGLLLGALRLFQLPEQRAVGLAQLIARGAEIAGLLDRGAVRLVQLDDLVHHRQLGVLEFLFDVLFDGLGVFPYKFDV